MPGINEAHKSLLAARGFKVPEEDFQDVMEAARGLSEVVRQHAAALSDAGEDTPFVVYLRKWAQVEDDSRNRESSGIRGGRNAETAVRQSLARIRSDVIGEIAWQELFESTALERAAALDRAFGAGQVRGPLHGVPIGIKDMFDLEGRVARYGSTLRDEAKPATADATVIKNLKDAGAIVLGVQHMAEFAMSPTGLNANLGPGKNPRNLDHVSGGSSSGGGMSVGAGHVPLAIGSDTGGSVRLPAGFCGATGLKPTQYSLPMDGVMPLAPSLDCVGPIGSTARDCAAAYFAMRGTSFDSSIVFQRPVHGFKVAVPQFKESVLLSGAMVQALTATVETLKRIGIDVVEAPMPDLQTLGSLASVLLAAESTAIHRTCLMEKADSYGRQVRRRLSRGLFISSIDYYDAVRLRTRMLHAFMQNTLGTAHALLLPLAPDAAPLIRDTLGSDEALLESRFSALSYWTRGINYLGVPALALPAGESMSALPLAIQFVGAPYSEETLLTLGDRFQQNTAWHKRTPDIEVVDAAR